MDIFLEDRTINIGNTISSLSSANLSENNYTESSVCTMHTTEIRERAEEDREQQNTLIPATEETSLSSTLIAPNPNPIPEILSISAPSSPCSQSSTQSRNNEQNENTTQKARRSKQLYELRKEMIEGEKKRIEVITQLTAAIEESNSIERQKTAAVEESNNIESQKVAAIQKCNDLQEEGNKLFEILIKLQRKVK